MAPLRNPPLIPNEANELILGERAMIITKKKIQNMFRIALDNGACFDGSLTMTVDSEA